jgi:hypothetical protein
LLFFVSIEAVKRNEGLATLIWTDPYKGISTDRHYARKKEDIMHQEDPTSFLRRNKNRNRRCWLISGLQFRLEVL